MDPVKVTLIPMTLSRGLVPAWHHAAMELNVRHAWQAVRSAPLISAGLFRQT